MGASFKIDKKQFNTKVETYKNAHNCTYMDAIISVCEIEKIEPETIGKIINKSIREKVDIEGQQLNLRPKKNSLPI